MIHPLNSRLLVRADLPAVSAILDSTGLFPSAMLADMAEPFLSAAADHLWLVICHHEDILGFAYCEPERLTDGTHNLLAIAVRPDRQRGGIGKNLVETIERHLAATGGRVLLVETSSLDDYEGTRAFYDTLGFRREASIGDFYADGDDKVVFWKRL